jgi:hypothetical protein
MEYRENNWKQKEIEKLIQKYHDICIKKLFLYDTNQEG